MHDQLGHFNQMMGGQGMDALSSNLHMMYGGGNPGYFGFGGNQNDYMVNPPAMGMMGLNQIGI
jgi:hypothetical protein